MTAHLTLSENERLILNTIRRTEPISRSAIHSQTPFTQPSVHRLLSGLEGKGLIRLGETKIKGPGKPSPLISLNRQGIYSVGISVNTDAITVCLANLACELVSEISFAEQSQDREHALALIQKNVHKILSEVNATEENLVGVCLGIPGTFTGEKNQINAPLPLKDWSLIDLGVELERYFQAPVSIENIATTGAIGESLIGAGKWTKTFAYVSFNYGFGGGAIIDGKPYYGGNGNAFELSAIYMEDEIERRPALGLLLEHLNQHGVEVQSIAELCSNFDPTWPGVESWVEMVLPQFNRAIWAIKGTFDPEAIILGGEIPQALAEMFIERVADQYAPPRYGVPMPTAKLYYTEASHVGAALGAAMQPLKAHFFL